MNKEGSVVLERKADEGLVRASLVVENHCKTLVGHTWVEIKPVQQGLAKS